MKDSAPALLPAVALRKESVDRNGIEKRLDGFKRRSLSARRAWIEIVSIAAILDFFPVALRKESVDRNKAIILTTRLHGRRSPQGERG